MNDADRQNYLLSVNLDESIGRSSPNIEHERAVALYDLTEENSFSVPEHPGPYRLTLSLSNKQLVLDIRSGDGVPVATQTLSIAPFRRIVKDYFLVCESYHEAIRTGSPARIEAIDMGRRSLHNEGSQILLDRLAGKVEIDFETARRLFTLVCVLHWRG